MSSINTNSEIHIVLCFDNNYVRQSSVLIKSILSTNKNEEISFHIISDNSLTRQSREILEVNAVTDNSYIFFYNFDSSRFNDFPSSKYVTSSTFFRYMTPYLLPETLGKVLYLDSDMLVLDSMRELWEMDIENYAVATALSANHNNQYHLKRLGIDDKYGYANIGTLLINLDYWRKNNISQKVFDYVANDRDKLEILDQDALNMVIYKNKKIVSSNWNLIDMFFMDKSVWNVKEEYHQEIELAIHNPKIIHFAGALKPWFVECIHPYSVCWNMINSSLAGVDKLNKVRRYNITDYIKYLIRLDILHRNRRFQKKHYRTAALYEEKFKN